MPAKVLALTLLNLYLTDADINIIKLSAHCLKGILATPIGSDAFSYLDTELQDLLTPYTKNSKSKPKKINST